MKKIHLFSLVALMAGMTITSCTSDDAPLEQTSVQGRLQMSIPATFVGHGDTRVLKSEEGTLKSEWTMGDKVYVHNGTPAFDKSPLTADADGSNVNLVGELEGTYTVGDELTLAYTYKEYPYPGVISGFGYSVQKGTFEDVQNYDFAVATAKVTAIEGKKVTTTEASFMPYQSIYKFTFKDESDNPVEVKTLTISSSNKKLIIGGRPYPGGTDVAGTVNIALETANAEVWAALCMDESVEADVIKFEVEDANGILYEGTKAATADKPVNGKYYQSAVTLEKVGEITLKITPETNRTLEGKVYTVTDDATATGYAKDYSIYINEGKTLTLNGVTLENGFVGKDGLNNTIVLTGENKVRSIRISPSLGGITFKGTGSLVMTSANDDYTKYSNIILQDGLMLTYNAETKVATIKPQDATEAIVFEDDAVKTACVKIFDTNGDEKISYGEAAAVTDLGVVFKGNTNIKNFTELRFFTGLTTIAASAFEGCNALETITLPNQGITSIGANAFKGATAMELFVIPTSVTSIGASAFEGCTTLKGTYNASYFIIPANVTEIGESAFKGCTSLAGLEIKSTNLTIGASAFENSYLMSYSVHFSTGKVALGNRAFRNSQLGYFSASGITEITFGEEVFSGCENLYLIRLDKVTTPPAFGKDMLKDCTNLTEKGYTWGIVVPAASVNDYKTAEGWKDYADIIFGN